MKDAVRLLLVLAVALIALGFVLGNFRPVYAESRDCGTAFSFSYDPQLPVCDGPLSDARVVPWVLMGLGAAAGVSALVVRRQREA